MQNSTKGNKNYRSPWLFINSSAKAPIKTLTSQQMLRRERQQLFKVKKYQLERKRPNQLG